MVLTDGGVYDNLGLAPLWPDRDGSISFHVDSYSRIIACRAGYALEAAPAPSLATTRVAAAFESIFARAQNFAVNPLDQGLQMLGAADEVGRGLSAVRRRGQGRNDMDDPARQVVGPKQDAARFIGQARFG